MLRISRYGAALPKTHGISHARNFTRATTEAYDGSKRKLRVNSRSIVLIVVTAGNREVTAVVDELFQLFSNLEEG